MKDGRLYQQNELLDTYAYDIYEALVSYATAFKLSHDIPLEIFYWKMDNKFSVTRTDKGGSDSMLFTVKYHYELPKNKIEIYSLNHNIIVKAIKDDNFASFVKIHPLRSEQNRLGIKNGVIFIDGIQKLLEFLSIIDKYIF